MFCNNPNCSHTTFAESYEFLPFKGKKTKRLEEEIVNVSLNVSSLTASSILNKGVAKVCKSTICNLLKKDVPTDDRNIVTTVCIDDFTTKNEKLMGQNNDRYIHS